MCAKRFLCDWPCLFILLVLWLPDSAHGQGQVVTNVTGGPLYFDPPLTVAFPGSGDSLPNAIGLNPSAAGEPISKLFAADNKGIWAVSNDPQAGVHSLDFPDSRVVDHAQVDPYDWVTLQPQKVFIGRFNTDEFLDVVTLDQIFQNNTMTSRVEIVWGTPSGTVIHNHHDLFFLAEDMAVHWASGSSGGMLCVVGGTSLALFRAPTQGTTPLEGIPAPSLTGVQDVVAPMVLNSNLAFVVAGNPAPLAAPPAVPVDTVVLQVFIPGSTDTPVTASFSQISTGQARQIVAVDLDGDEDEEIVLATGRSPEIDNGLIYLFDTSVTNGDLSITEIKRFGMLGEPTALACADLGSTPEIRDGLPEMIVAGHLSEKDPCWLKVFKNPGSLSATWPRLEIQLDYRQSQLFDEFYPNDNQTSAFFNSVDSVITDLAVGLVNDDNIPDIVAVNPGQQTAESVGELVLLCGQPPPIATFITVATHGHRGVHSIMHESCFGVPTEEPMLDEFNAALGDIVFEINRARRNIDPQLPPVRHIGISGHWGDLTERGATLHVVGRAGWLSSCYLVFAPSCILPIPAGPAVHPVPFWASAFFLVVPSNSIVLPCVPGTPDPATYARFVCAAFGAGAEMCGRSCSATGSRTAATELAAHIDAAVEQARLELDPCRGQIYLELSGHSRGTTVNMQALRGLAKAPLRFNSTITFTDLDGIDPAPFDQLRPWARAGYFVGDPRIGCGVGNEQISSIYSAYIFSLTSPILTPFAPSIAPPVGAAEGFVFHEIIGLPVGHNRSGDFNSGAPTASNGPMLFAAGLDHNLHSHYWDPAQLTASLGNVLPGGFSVESTTTLGRLMPDTNNNPANLGPRAVIPDDAGTDGPGWIPAAAPCTDRRLPAGFDEQLFLPEECRSDTADDPDVDGLSDVEDQSFAQSSRRAERVREYVADHDFNTSLSIVRNAKEFFSLKQKLSKRDWNRLNDGIHPDVRAFLNRCAAEEFVPESVWMTVRATGSRKQVRFQGVGKELSINRMQTVISRAQLPLPDGGNQDAVEKYATRAEKYLKQMSIDNPTEFGDTISYFQRVLSGAVNLEEAFAQFPDSYAAIAQDLHPASVRARDRLTLEIDVAFLGTNRRESNLTVEMKSRNFETSIPASGQRRVVRFRLPSRADIPSWIRDRVVLRGRKARVFSVSVRAEGPIRNPVDGHWYDIRVFEEGIDWDYARHVASRIVFNGNRGELATLTDPRAYEFLQKAFDIDTFVWLGGRAEPNSGNEFQWLDGTTKPTQWHPDTIFPVPLKQSVYAFGYPKDAGPMFGYLPQQTVFRNRSIGVLIDFGK